MLSRADELALRQERELRLARKSFLSFCLYVTPTFKVNWHIHTICQAVDDLVFGDLRRLFVAIQPQIGKSTLMSIHFPAFMLGVNPDCRMMAASYGISLAAHFNKEVQSLMQGESYQRVFPASKLRGFGSATDNMEERTQKTFRLIGRRGGLRSLSTASSATGFSADVALIDDPHKDAAEAASERKREAVFTFFRGTLLPRLQQGGKLCIIGTRWNDRDLGSHALELAADPDSRDPWRVISIPAIKETPPTAEDPREIGEALWPERFTVDTLLERKKQIGEREFNALYQQRCAPMEGSLVKIRWFQTYVRPPTFEAMVISADLTFSDKGDYCCFTAWGVSGADRYLVDLVRERMTFTEQLHAFSAFCRRNPQAEAKLVEAAANGAALVDTLKRTIPGIIPITVRTSKEARVASVAPLIEAGNVWLPRQADAPWVAAYLEEFRSFPNGANDDQVDSSTLAWNYIQQRHLAFNYQAISITERVATDQPGLAGHYDGQEFADDGGDVW